MCRKRAPASTQLCAAAQRVVVVDGRVLEAPLDEPHRATLEDVDRRVEDHAATLAHTRAKLASSARPSREDFSGWNCTP